MTKRVFVASEFAPLRTVVVARSQVRLSDAGVMSEAQSEARLAILPESERELARRLMGRDHAEAMPERQKAWEGERLALQAVLEKHGVRVLLPSLLTQAQKEAGGQYGYSNCFVRDPWFTVGDVVVEASLRSLHRRREVLPCRPLFEQEVSPAECAYVSVPQPDAAPIDAKGAHVGPFLEGGDTLVLGKHVFVGNSGQASSEAGVAFLRKLLAPRGYVVESVRLKSNFLHLDCALGLVRQGLLVACREALLDGLPSVLRDWECIEVSEDEATRLGTNGLPISPDVYVTDPVFHRIGDAIARHGVKVEYVDFTISRAFGGAFRCSTQPLWRE
ncbi:amidinotransferase [Myxococcus stipitatus]|uniref:dimethylarginine dimethylaminohydrolase family protein n=1 Tax=Myxococcus stipitatus TaxID=83455 RepID=UPI0030D54E01